MEHDCQQLHRLLDHHQLYRLTTLQIGDMQSYVSRLFLHITCEGSKLVFLVDNGPWTAKKWRSKPAELWQLMVTQSRVSPFANRRSKSVQDKKENFSAQNGPIEEIEDIDILSKGTCRMTLQDEGYSHKPFQDALRKHLTSLVRVKELSSLLHGCVAFELDWENVRGINYVNELQTDTCVALEAKALTKRDFDSLQQALKFYDCNYDDTGHKDSASSEAKSSNSFPETGCSGSSILAKRGRLNGCAKLKVNVLDRQFNSQELATVCSNVADDTSGSYRLKKRRVSSTRQRSFFDECGSGGYGKDSTILKSSELDGKVLQKNDCDLISASECCWGSTERLNLTRCHSNCDNILVEDFERSEQQFTGQEMKSCFDHNSLMETCEKEGDNQRVVTCSLGNCYNDVSSNFCCKDLNRSDAGLDGTCVHLDFVSHVYRDMLVLFRFCDPILPLKLKKIITVDQRLLKLLESGLPSWVIFLQSYPIFCNIYRPWMWPLARTMYFLVSVITVIIGFYDLYKNVPVLKATAARLCGPLFDWIEAWEMVSRLKYLGTMLFLQNCEKAFKWLVMIVRTLKHLASIVMQPMVEPLWDLLEYLSPVWSIFAEGAFGFGTHFWSTFSSLLIYINSLLQSIIWPVFVLLTAIWRLVTLLLYPVLAAIWAVIMLPLQLITKMVNLIVIILCCLLKIILNIWQCISYSIQLISVSGPPNVTPLKDVKSLSRQVSPLWRTLPNDLLSKVFRAIRSIVNGLVAFFTACNRHRLSIYNHVSAFLLRMVHLLRCAHSLVSNAYQRIHKLPFPSDDKLQEEVSACASFDTSILPLGQEDEEEEEGQGITLNLSKMVQYQVKKQDDVSAKRLGRQLCW